MTELFKWLACHPDVTLVCKFDDTGLMPYSEDFGNVVITMMSDWTSHRQIINIYLLLAAQSDRELASDILDQMYGQLMGLKKSVMRDAIKRIKELPDGYKK